MRTPEPARLVRNAYFRENVPKGNLSISDERVASSSSMGPSSAATAELIRADLYFESAANHGKWRILCSSLCLGNLARDGAQSDPVLKRLEYVLVNSLQTDTKKECLYFTRELSLGSFSETNQKRLTRTSPIEIYRARLPGIMRLVVCHHLRDLGVTILMFLQV
jgi:hypothetical protein